MTRCRWPYVAIATGSLMSAGSCFSLAILGGLPTLPVSTAYSATALLAGSVVIVAGVALLLKVTGAIGGQRHKGHPARSRTAARPDGHSAGRAHNCTVQRARLRGGLVAGPRETDGGGPATETSDDVTELLPAVDDDEVATQIFTLPPEAGRGGRGYLPGRLKLRTVVGPARSPVRTVAAPVSRGSGAATTLTLPPVTGHHTAEAPQRGRQLVLGAAAPVLIRTTAGAAQPPPQTWTAGSAVNGAGLESTTD